MPIYDPAWDMPEANWRPVGSFQRAAPSPGVDPTAEPVVCIPVNAAWVKVLIGCIDQLCIPATWAASSDDDLNGILQWVALLKQQVANAEACMQLRWSDADCAVEQSTDGGATWAKISGWPVGPPACFVGATGATGAAGAAGAAGATGPAGPASIWRMSGCALQYSNDGGSTWTTATGWDVATLQTCLIGAPPNPQGVSVPQAACNIAAWLAQDVIKAQISSMISSIGAGASLLSAVAAALDLIPGIDVTLGFGVTAAALLFSQITAAGTAIYSTAVSNATLWSDVQCAVYNAIKADGAVTVANFSTILTNINAISYAVPSVVGVIHNVVQSYGAAGLMAVQSEGSLYAGDCSACGTWCYEWDNTTHAPLNSLWLPYTPPGTATFGGGVWNAANSDPPTWNIYLQIALDPTRTYTDVSFVTNAAAGSRGADIRFYSGAVGTSVLASVTGIDAATLSWHGSVSGAHTLLIDISNHGPAFSLSQITMRGNGANPFGPDNC